MPLSAALPGLKVALAAALGKDDVSDATAKANIQSMADDVADAIHAYATSGLVTSTGATLAHTAGAPASIVGLPGVIT